MPRINRLINIGECLRLHTLGRIHDKKRTLTSGERPADFIGEVHMAGCVHQIQHIGFAILGGIGQANRLRLDGDAAFALQLHIIQDLFLHFARGQRAGLLDQPVSKRGFPVIDMGDDREIADQRKRRVSHDGPGGAGAE